MNYDEAKKELANIKTEISNIIQKYYKIIKEKPITEEEEQEIKNEIRLIYNKYLKICSYTDVKTPKYNNGTWPYDNNCYYYALDLKKPKIFQDTYNEIFYELFSNQLGSIGNISLPRHFTEEDLLKALYADLDALGIQSYESSIDKKPEHGGYKIAVYIRDKSDYSRPDFHFIRQNKDGSWSEKRGNDNTIYIVSDPYNLENRPNYRYIKTIEIVKPKLQELPHKKH